MNFVEQLQNIPQPQQRTTEWYQQRESLITSSNIATILDLNPYKTSKAYLNEVLNGSSFAGNPATIHGTNYENASITAYQDAFGYSGVELGLIKLYDNRAHRDREYIINQGISWLAGSVDKLVWPEEIENPSSRDCIAVENKCPFYRTTLNYGEVKSYYWPQLQFNMYILDTDRGDYIEMIPDGFKGSRFRMNVVRVYRDDLWIKHVALPKLEEFHNFVSAQRRFKRMKK